MDGRSWLVEGAAADRLESYRGDSAGIAGFVEDRRGCSESTVGSCIQEHEKAPKKPEEAPEIAAESYRPEFEGRWGSRKEAPEAGWETRLEERLEEGVVERWAVARCSEAP